MVTLKQTDVLSSIQRSDPSLFAKNCKSSTVYLTSASFLLTSDGLNISMCEPWCIYRSDAA